MSNKTQKVVFIVSAVHSGSTLLELILSSHPRVFGLGELNQLHSSIDNSVENVPELCSVCEGECEFWNRRVPLPVIHRYFSHKHRISPFIRYMNHYRRSIYRYFFEWTACDILTDSSKDPAWVKRQLRPNYCWGNKMTPMIILLTRDGRAVINSLLRKYPHRNVEQLAFGWKRRMELATALYQKMPSGQRHTVSYERLATQPSETVDAVCKFLGVEYVPKMLSYWENEHHIHGGNTGTQSLIARFRSQFERGRDSSWDSRFETLRVRHGEYYDKLGLEIELDLRWKDELSKAQLDVFEAVAGETNKPFAYPA